MTYKVNKSISAKENLYALIQYTWPDHAGVLNEDNVSVSVGPSSAPGVLSVTLSPSESAIEVIGVKTVTYNVVDLTLIDTSDFISDPENLLGGVDAYIKTLPCAPSEITVSAINEDEENGWSIGLSAIANALTVKGSVTLDLNVGGGGAGDGDDGDAGEPGIVEGTPPAMGTVNGVAYSPDGQYVALAGFGGDRLSILRTSDWSAVPDTPKLPNAANDIAFSPDGSVLAVSMTSSPGIRLFNTSDWSTILGISSPSNSWGLGFSPDGRYLMSVHSQGGMRIYDATNNWSIVTNIPKPASPGHIRSVAFSPDGRYAAMSHIDGTRLTIYRVSNWTIVANTPTIPGSAYGLGFSPDSRYLAVGHANDKRLTIINTSYWSVVSGTPAIAGTAHDAKFSPDGNVLAVAHSGAPNLTMINANNWSVIPDTSALTGIAKDVAFSPDGKFITAGHETTPFMTTIRL